MKTPDDIRRDAFELALELGCPHIAPSLSTVEILASVYAELGDEDKFILSKGHGCMAWYVILKELGHNPQLKHHPDIDVRNGIECTTGSLGHGLPMAVGMALAKKISKDSGTIYVLMGDGECQEGTTWESAMIAAQYNLNNLCLIVDRNRLQTLDSTENIVALDYLVDKFQAFGWFASEVDGHDTSQLFDYLFCCDSFNRPKVLVATTIKGKGISYMENVSKFHARLPNEEEIAIARKELE